MNSALGRDYPDADGRPSLADQLVRRSLQRMRRALLALCALVIAAPTLILGPPATAAPGDTVGPLGAGADVSFPQQGQPLPEPVDFGIVGVNGRDFASYNPDLARQWG